MSWAPSTMIHARDIFGEWRHARQVDPDCGVHFDDQYQNHFPFHASSPNGLKVQSLLSLEFLVACLSRIPTTRPNKLFTDRRLRLLCAFR